MSNAIQSIERQIARTSHTLGIERDLHGADSPQANKCRSKLAALRNERLELKRQAAMNRGAVLA